VAISPCRGRCIVPTWLHPRRGTHHCGYATCYSTYIRDHGLRHAALRLQTCIGRLASHSNMLSSSYNPSQLNAPLSR
jgi:hypothetical protein